LREYFYYFFIDFTKLGSQIMDDSLSSTSFEDVWQYAPRGSVLVTGGRMTLALVRSNRPEA